MPVAMNASEDATEEGQSKVVFNVLVKLGMKEDVASLAAHDPCNFSGLFCNFRGEVVALGFSGGFWGSLSQELGKLPQLEMIWLQDNEVEGPIPQELGKLQRLRVLRLGNNRLSGQIPKELGNAVALEFVDLSANLLEGQIPRELGHLSKLHTLALGENHLSGPIPHELGSLPNLNMLQLTSNHFTGEIPSLDKLEKLTVLSMAENRLEGALPQLPKSKLLVSMHLTGNNFSGELPRSWGGLVELEHLALSRNSLTGSFPKEFGNLKRLGWLFLSQNQLSGNIPKEISGLKSLRYLVLYQNQLTGNIPAEFGQLHDLEELVLFHNQLSGNIPPELGRMKALQRLELYANQLNGSLPGELAELRNLTKLSLAQNHLTGSIPVGLGQLEHLQELNLAHNMLTGQIPKELSQLGALEGLWLGENQLTGSLPKELGQLKQLEIMCLEHNQLAGEIPEMFEQLRKIELLRLEHNQLSGEIPRSIWRLRNLSVLHLHENRFEGAVPGALEMKELTVLDLHGNFLSGRLPAVGDELVDLQYVDLGRNLFAGPSTDLVESLCGCCNQSLLHLRLDHNQLTGTLPPCLLQLRHLKYLALNNNRFSGSIPAIHPNKLMVLTLHANQFTGSLPYSLKYLQHLAVLTVHENSLDGKISEKLQLTGPCIDNPNFKIRGAPCMALATFFIPFKDDVHAWDSFLAHGPKSCEEVLPKFRYTGKELQDIKENCPVLCNLCGDKQSAKATFHHNRFSCEVPASISNASDVHATVVMGNMVGHGYALNASWISAEENQAFLYYSPKVWRDHMFLMSTVLTLGLCVVLFQKQLQRRLGEASRSLGVGNASRVAASNLALLRIAACVVLICGPLLLTFLAGTGYYMCAPILSQLTIANLREDCWAELVVVILWCTLTLLFHIILASMPKSSRRSGVSHTGDVPRLTTFGGVSQSRKQVTSWRGELGKLVAWIFWILVVSLLSLPSILFAVAQALPAQNTSGLSEEMLSYVHRMAPFLIVAIDMFLSGPLSNRYSACSGIQADLLLMTFRLFAAWLLSLLTTIFLHESCLGGWKRFWIVCKEGAPEHDTFNWKVWEEEILNTNKDMCQLRERWWAGGRCSRSIVEGLNTLMLKKLLIRCTVQPLVLLLLWRFSHLESESSKPASTGRHLQLFLGKGPKMTGSLVPLQQMALLTTFMEILFFWSPLMPLLSGGVLCVAAANLFLFDVGIWTFKVRMPTDAVNQNAALSRSYMTLALAASCGFQLWHAFGTEMCGRQVLLLLNVVLLLPFKHWMLPLDGPEVFFGSKWRRPKRLN